MLPLRHSFKVVLQPNDGVIERQEDLISKSGKTPFGRAAKRRGRTTAVGSPGNSGRRGSRTGSEKEGGSSFTCDRVLGRETKSDS